MTTNLITETPDQTASPTSYKKGRRLRPNRLLLQGLLADEVSMTGFHAVLSRLTGRALDLSIHGARVVVERLATQQDVVLQGDRLEDITLMCGDATIYRGAGTIARICPNDSFLELGIDLVSAGIDLETVHRKGARKSVDERWVRSRSLAGTGTVSPEFRGWILDLANFLDTSRAFLDEEEVSMTSWDLATRRAISNELLQAVAPDVIERMNLAGRQLHDLVGALDKNLHVEYRAFLHKHLGALLSRSPFLHRARTKPLGYAGDYEMMNMLYRDHAEGSTLFGKALNLYATQSPVAQANINRIEFLGRKIMAAIERKPTGRVKIASIGCGPAQEIQTLLANRPDLGHRLDIALVDQEERAISYCERTLAPVAARTDAKILVIRESVRRLLTDRKLGQALGPCELIYSAGLFDYFNDRTFDALLRTLRDAVIDGGDLIIGNVAANNPNRWAMEYFTEWFLNHRSLLDLRNRAAALDPPARAIETTSEPLGVNLFLIVTR